MQILMYIACGRSESFVKFNSVEGVDNTNMIMINKWI